MSENEISSSIERPGEGVLSLDQRHRFMGHLLAFYAAAKTGSIQAGARELGLSRNSLARYLDELEAASHTPLRKRDGEARGLALTDAGRHLLALLEPLFTRLETVGAELVGGLPELRLGCQSSTSCYLLPGWIKAFEAMWLEEQPEGTGPPRFSLKTGSSEAILAALGGLEVDLGIVATDDERGRSEGGIAYLPLVKERLLAICPKGHPLAEGGPVSAERFARHPQYLYYRGGARYEARINALAPGAGATRQMEFDTIQAIKETVRAGLGVSIVPGGAVRKEDRTWLALVPLDVPPSRAHLLVRTLAAVTREGDRLTFGAWAFREFLRTQLRG